MDSPERSGYGSADPAADGHAGAAADEPAAAHDPAAAHASPQDPAADPRLQRWQQRFFWPVVIAAVASVPAMFLTVLTEGPLALTGEAINYVSMAVFAAETVVLLALAGDRWQWLRDHWYIAAITAVTIPAVILAIGPAQVLRLLVQGWRVVRLVGAFRIIRVGRIFKAGKILYRRSGFSGPVRTGIAFTLTALAAVFVAVVLSDPDAESRQFLQDFFGDAWLVAVIVAGVILAAATFAVALVRRDDDSDPSEPSEPSEQPTGSGP